MADTPYYGLTTPDLTDPPDGPAQMAALAADIENLLKNGFQMPTGDLTIGDAAFATARALKITRLSGADAVEYRFRSAGANIQLETYLNAVAAAIFGFWQDGRLTITAGGVARPVPFATYADIKSIALTSEGFKAVTVTFNTGRFIVKPAVLVTPYGNVSYYGYSASGSAASCTIGVCHRDGTAASATVEAHMMAVQMGTSAAPGLLATEPATRIAICHTDGCENADAQIEIIDADTDIYCGPCGQPITDVVSAT